MNYLQGQSGLYSHGMRMQKRVLAKYPKDKLTHNDFYFSFAKSLRDELEELRKTLTNGKKVGNIPEPLIEVIERTYGRAMQATNPNFYRGPRVSTEFFKCVDALDKWTCDQKKHMGENTDPQISSNLQKKLSQLFDAIEHYIKQCRMTRESYKPGYRLPFNPTNWEIKKLILTLINEHMPTGKKEFPPYKLLSRKLSSNKPELILSERTYRLYKRQIENGTFTHMVQKKRQQVTLVHDT
jgi:hypothetical protein